MEKKMKFKDAKHNNLPARVQVSSNLDGKRRWDKRHCCLFCKGYFLKMALHLENAHPDEVEVAQAFSHPKSSDKRSYLVDQL